jgi:hypothetical protein
LLNPDLANGDQNTLLDVPRWWVALDLEGVQRPAHLPATDLYGCADLVLRRLPEIFRKAHRIIQASGGHGIKPDIRLRIWYWLDRAVTCRELKLWLRGTPADPALFNSAQLCYTAAPSFENGAVDPVPRRIASIAGTPTIPVPPPETFGARPRESGRNAASALPAAGSHLGDQYARAALVRAVDRILQAEKRHPAIIAECRSLARLVHSGILAESHFRTVVEQASRAVGKNDEREITACIEWGLAHPSLASVGEVSRGH